MPLWKFRRFEDAELDLHRRPVTADVAVRTALALLTISEATRRGIRTAQLGLVLYRTIEEGERDRVRHALAALRAAGPEPPAS